MITAEAEKIQTLPLSKIDWEKGIYSFRQKPINHADLKKDMEKLGQLFPITVEQFSNGNTRLLDGFKRCQAASKLQTQDASFGELNVELIPSSQLSEIGRFKLICDKNLYANKSFGLAEQASLIKFFHQRGLSLKNMSDFSPYSLHQLEDLLDLAESTSPFSQIVNKADLDPAMGVMLWRRYQGWIQTPYKKEANQVAKNLVEIADKEKVSIKSWRFYLDFYWKEDGTQPSFI